MSRVEVQSAEDFILNEVILTSDRFNGSAINLTNVVAELNIFESIYEQYLTGSIFLVDDNDLYRSLNLQGTERIKIILSLPGGSATPIEKNFVIVNIQKSYKYNDYTTTFVFTIIEDYGFYNETQKISKSYDGRGEDIIEKILIDNLNVKLDRNIEYKKFKQSHQSPFRYIVPYQTPLEAAKTVLQKMSTVNGSPYYLYSSLSSDNMILADLETIIERVPINIGKPFAFTQANNKNISLKRLPYSIYTYETPNVEDTLMLSQMGAIGSLHSAFNITTGQKTLEHVDVNFVLQRLKQASVIKPDQELLLDNKFKPDPEGKSQKTLGEYNSKYYHQIGGNTYPFSPNVRNWTEEQGITDYQLRIMKYCIEQFLLKNTINITVPGLLFLAKNPRYDVGNQINILLNRNSIPDNASAPVDLIDEKKSGSYIVLSKRHIFKVTDQSHIVSLECSRLTNTRSTNSVENRR